MADAPTIGSILVSVVPVVVGGLLAAGAGAGTQWMLHRAKVSEEKRTRRAVKYEELVQAIYEHDHWLNSYRSKSVYGEENVKDSVSPIAKVEAIAAVYFPEYSEKVRQLDLAADEYVVWMLDRSQARLRVEIDKLNDGGVEVARKYMKLRIDLLHELRKLAQTGL